LNTLTLQDIADLAEVQRPVVSMWRKRPMVRGVSMPFPDPVDTVDGAARFSRHEVVDWLARTGRGNNTEHNYDAPAIAVPDGVALVDVVTLLCWHVLTGRELTGLSKAALITSAEQFDPDDTLLVAELRALAVSDELLGYVDDLLEASLGPADALQRVDSGRLKRDQQLREFTDEAVILLRCVIEAAAIHLEHDEVVLRTDGSSMALDVAEALELDVVTKDRQMRRRAVIRGIHVREGMSRKQVSAVSVVGLDNSDALDQADEVMLSLQPGDIAIVVGSGPCFPMNWRDRCRIAAQKSCGWATLSQLCECRAGSGVRRTGKALRYGFASAGPRLSRFGSRTSRRSSISN